jgi:hypothetical protein
VARGNDAVIGILLALVGIGILVAWRNGALKGLVGGADYSSASHELSERAARSGILDIADRIRAIPPATNTNGPGSGDAAAGLPDDGHSSTYAPLIDVWAAGGRLDESTRAARRTAPATETVTQAVNETAPTGPWRYFPGAVPLGLDTALLE